MPGPADLGFVARDERRHDLTEAAVEVWSLDFVQSDASIGATFVYALTGAGAHAAFHASVVGPDSPLVTLSDVEIATPSMSGLELRAPGLWTEYGIQTPWEHTTVDIEAFAVALDDPDDVFGRAYGERVALGSELEWEQADDVRAVATARPAEVTGYAVACAVHGELLLRDAVIEIDGWGWRSHWWGARPAEAEDRREVRGRRSDGSWWFETDPDLAMAAVLGRAPLARLTATDARPVDQRLVEIPGGDIAWVRQIG